MDEFGPQESADELQVLKAKVEQLELREKELLQAKQDNETEFGQKRAKFRELFLQKEAELKADRELRSSLESQLMESKTELENIKMAVSVSEANKEEEIAKVRRVCEQEVETMQALLREAAEEASSSTAAQYESERAKLKELNENYEEEIQTIRSRLSQERNIEKGKGFLSSVADIVSRGTASLNPSSTESENLEEAMKKAQQDAEILKSVVMPLEQEIAALKEKVTQQTDNIRKLEKDKFHLQERLTSGSLPDELPSPAKTTSLPSLDDVTDPEEKIQLLMKYLKTEKASRSDLEMYVAVINIQKNVLQEEADKIRGELKEVCGILDEEKREHSQLKQTWQMANDQFLESQRLMMMDMRRMEGLLSAEQHRMLSEQQQKDEEREAQERKVRELEEQRQKQEQSQLQQKQDAAKEATKSDASDMFKKPKKKEAKLQERLMKDKSQSNTSINSHSSVDSMPFDESLSLGEPMLKKSHSDLEISSLSEQDLLDTGETRSLNEMDNVMIRISPEKVINLPSLTEAQVKAITDPTPENEARRSLIANAKSRAETISLEGRRLVSDKEWNLLQQELKAARDKLGRPCDMCINYEAQLQGVQDEVKNEQAKVRSLDRELAADKVTIDSQKKYIKDLEESLKDAADNANEEISSLSTKVNECERYISELRQHHNTTLIEMQDNLKQLSDRREEVQTELTRLQEENDSLQGKHSKHSEQLQNEDINLPNNLEEMQLLLLKYREEIIAAKVGKEHIEETLKSQLMFVRDQLTSEQQEKNNMEEALTHEINSLQEKLAIQDSIKSELERESSVRAETEARFREVDQALKSQQVKYKQLIHGLQKQLDEQGNIRTQLESDVQRLKGKISSQQSDLDNSVAVQGDLVKLSQSLQIELEHIRQAETEVRWQNDEDVDNCYGCKQPFGVAKRKIHCRHCGQIFCMDCLTKTVNSGPKRRPTKVCDVCHTLLVKDATPYFSTELPNTPD